MSVVFVVSMNDIEFTQRGELNIFINPFVKDYTFSYRQLPSTVQCSKSSPESIEALL